MAEFKERLSRWYQEMTSNKLIEGMAQRQVLEIELNEHLQSDNLKFIQKAQAYYRNKTKIQDKRVDLDWKNNAKIELGIFRRLVNQKVNYLLAKEPSVTVEDKKSQEILDEIFDAEFFKAIKSLGREAIIKKIAYSILYYDEKGKLCLFKVPTEQIIPFWSDERRLTVDAFMRVYENNIYSQGAKRKEQVVEYWDENGITYYLVEEGRLKPHPRYQNMKSHFGFMNPDGSVQYYNWEKVPLIAWRYNADEDSLLSQVESLIDNLSMQTSTNADLLADLPKLVYVLKNYGGEDLSQFINQLNKYMSIKVNENGGVDTLSATPQTVGAEAEMKRIRKAIYEAGSGIDTQDENLGNASGVALKFRYNDLDLDCNDMENEFQGSIQQLLWFIEKHAQNIHQHQVDLSTFQYTFNRDIIINESEAIMNVRASVGILDDKTIRMNHPWYSSKVEERLEGEIKDSSENYDSSFSRSLKKRDGDVDG